MVAYQKWLKKKKLCSSLRSWRLFCCLFSFVVRKVRDSAAQKLNRGRKRKRWGRGRGEKAVRKTSPEPLFPIVRFSSLVQLSLGLISYFTNHKLKERIHTQKKLPATRASCATPSPCWSLFKAAKENCFEACVMAIICRKG